jgi:hypothetical protein
VTVPTNTYQFYQQVGVKENISDVISNLSPRKTPMQSALGNEKVTQPLFQWQEDSLRAVAVNAKIDGDDASFVAIVPTVMRNNYTQIFSEAIVVSDRADVISTYGRKREFAYQMAKSAAQVKRDREHALVGTAGTKSAGNATTASTMAGFQQQLDSDDRVLHGRCDCSERSWPRRRAADRVHQRRRADPHPRDPENSVVLAAFASAAGRYRTITGPNDKTTTLVNVVNLYVSPFGEQKVEINRFQKAKNTLIFEPDQWTNVTLRPWERKDLAKTGDSTKAMILGEFSLKHKNFFASAAVIDNATTGF